MKAFNMYEINRINYFKQTLSTVSIMFFDRIFLDSFLATEESNHPAVYILYNESGVGESSVYIGETENIGHRLKQHNKNFGKTFWTGTIVVQTNDGSFNKAHYKYLEYMLYERAVFANRYRLANKVSPTKSSLSRNDQISADMFLEETYRLLKILRFYFFEHPYLGDTNENTDIFYLYHPFGTGKMQVLDNDKFVLLKDSVIVMDGENDFTADMKKDYIKSGKIKVIEGTKFAVLLENIIFESDNDAAAFVTASTEADWTMWVNINRETAHTVLRRGGE